MKLCIILFDSMRELLLFCMIISITLSCKKNNTNDTDDCSTSGYQYLYIDTSMMGFLFKDGSYWIYECDSTNYTDSTVIVNADSSCAPVFYGLWNEGRNWINYNMLYYSYRHKFFSSYNDYIGDKMMTRNSYPFNFLLYGYGDVILFSTYDTSVYLPFPTHIDSITIGKVTFYNIQKATYEKTHEDVYTAYNIGVVRKVVKDDHGEQVWNLVRWKIYK